MSRNKKFIIVGALAAVVLAGSIGGVALARAGSYSPIKASANQDVSGNATQPKTLLARVAEILGIDQSKLESAVKQAKGEQQLQALKNRLQKLVDAGKITQAQADAYLKWYQSKPDLAPFELQLKNWQQARPQVPDSLKQWEQARPKDIPIPGNPGGNGQRAPMRRPVPRGGGMGGPMGGGLRLPPGGPTQ